MAVKVRRAGVSELELLMKWRMRVLREVFSLDKDADEAVLIANNEAYYREHLSDGTHTACFAEDDETGEIAGCGGICYQNEMPSPDNQTGTNGYLMNIFVLPEFRGRGIGKNIILFLIEDAKRRGTEKIYLESSETAKRLYEDMGFLDMKDYMKL